MPRQTTTRGANAVHRLSHREQKVLKGRTWAGGRVRSQRTGGFRREWHWRSPCWRYAAWRPTAWHAGASSPPMSNFRRSPLHALQPFPLNAVRKRRIRRNLPGDSKSAHIRLIDRRRSSEQAHIRAGLQPAQSFVDRDRPRFDLPLHSVWSVFPVQAGSALPRYQAEWKCDRFPRYAAAAHETAPALPVIVYFHRRSETPVFPPGTEGRYSRSICRLTAPDLARLPQLAQGWPGRSIRRYGSFRLHEWVHSGCQTPPAVRPFAAIQDPTDPDSPVSNARLQSRQPTLLRRSKVCRGTTEQ